MIPSSTEISHFIETYQTRHVSKAAMRLGVTQPTLTQSLQRLERKLGTSLFYRTKQGVIPTAQAAVFYHRAQALIDCWSEIENGVVSAENEIAGTFTVGCHQSVGAYALPELFARLSSKAPKIRIKLIHDFSRKITEGVVSYEIDLGFVVNPQRHPDLVLSKLGDDRVTFWKKRGLKNPSPILFADGNREQIEDLLGKTRKKFFSGWSLVSSSSLELIRTLTCKGLGVGILPERVAHAENSDLVLFDEDLPSRPDEIYLVYRKEVMSSKAGRELLRHAAFGLS